MNIITSNEAEIQNLKFVQLPETTSVTLSRVDAWGVMEALNKGILYTKWAFESSDLVALKQIKDDEFQLTEAYKCLTNLLNNVH